MRRTLEAAGRKEAGVPSIESTRFIPPFQVEGFEFTFISCLWHPSYNIICLAHRTYYLLGLQLRSSINVYRRTHYRPWWRWFQALWQRAGESTSKFFCSVACPLWNLWTLKLFCDISSCNKLRMINGETRIIKGVGLTKRQLPTTNHNTCKYRRAFEPIRIWVDLSQFKCSSTSST